MSLVSSSFRSPIEGSEETPHTSNSPQCQHPPNPRRMEVGERKQDAQVETAAVNFPLVHKMEL